MSDLPEERSYQLLAQISKNTSTEIHEVVEVTTREVFAIKIPLPDCEQTYIEAGILPELDHPAIIRLVDVVPTGFGPGLVIPYARGGTIYNLVISRGALPEPVVKVVVSRMLSAVAYLHARRIVHRDIKLENMLLMTDDAGDVVLGDFGLAVELSEGACETRACGTPEYAAPEMWQCLQYCEKVDIWSLGVGMFVMLVGEFPYALEFGRVAMESIEDGIQALDQHPGLQGVSIAGRHLLWRMLQIGAEDRIGAAEALEHSWFAPSASDGQYLQWR